ncbi:AMP-binding protein [Afipia sp. GAS231]|uniref:AMP-binding protein n=1 Tax=Afipia sp. GAS231 TaxID=1882747 RepID=UPI000B809B21|nr:AMP-binding protein [Afipia sp. GAS231]
MAQSSLTAVLRERASLQPNETAYTYVDYDQDRKGVPLTLSWSQLYRRVVNLGEQIKHRGSAGDRVLILAPQGLDYVVSFLGALQAGRVAVPLSVPNGRVHDERVVSVLADASPSVVLTTSAVIDNVSASLQSHRGQFAPAIIEVDLLDLDSRQRVTSPRIRGANDQADCIYLQYTSGSTRTPAGVMVSNKNVFANFRQMMADFFAAEGGVLPGDSTIVSWLPLYHDMGLQLGVVFPILAGTPTLLTSPMGFFRRPARWLQLLARNGGAISGAPNFAYELAAQKTSDDDMAGLDLGGVHTILNGSERVQPATLKLFADRFAAFNFDPKALRPSYGMAEATVYIATRRAAKPPEIANFDVEKLAAGQANRCETGSGTPLVSYGTPGSMLVRIVDPNTNSECPDGTVGEIWVHGDNVATGYWHKPEESQRTFGAKIADPSQQTPEAPWLRTGDTGFFSDGELFIIGRIKDLLIVYGRNHSPEDIEMTIRDITAGRCVAIAVPDKGIEKLVVVIELRKRGVSDEEVDRLRILKREVTSAISESRGLSVADLVLVSPGSIPVTTSGKIRRSQCVELYRQNKFTRVDA